MARRVLEELSAASIGEAWRCVQCGEMLEPQFAACWQCGQQR
jgi:uncharacterized OB-fold protein